MPNMLDDAVGTMVGTLLAVAGSVFSYRPIGGGAVSSVTARKSTLPSYQVETAGGQVIEVRPVDFLMKTTDLPFGDPVKGQRFETGDEVYEVWSVSGEKCFRQISPQMTRIHTKRVQ